jgi:hypothetical protein
MLHLRSLILLSVLTFLGTTISAMESDDEITDFPPSRPPSPVEEITEFNEELIPTHSKRKKRLSQRRGLRDSSNLLDKLSRAQPRSSHPSRQADESSPEIPVEEEKENVPPSRTRVNAQPLRDKVILNLGISQPVKGNGYKKRKMDQYTKKRRTGN